MEGYVCIWLYSVRECVCVRARVCVCECVCVRARARAHGFVEGYGRRVGNMYMCACRGGGGRREVCL